MEIKELTKENIEQYLDSSLEVQKYLVSQAESINSDFFRKTAECSHSYFVGVIDQGRVVGMGVLSKIVHPVRTNGYINNIVVHPNEQGKGLFSLIMDDLEKKAKLWECTQVELTCSRDAVQGMYEKRGYIQKNTNFYLFKI